MMLICHSQAVEAVDNVNELLFDCVLKAGGGEKWAKGTFNISDNSAVANLHLQ
jgi:hypothetical protein